MERFVDDVVVTRDEFLDKIETTSVNPDDKINYWLIAVVLLTIAYLLLLVIIVVRHYIKQGLLIPCSLSYQYSDK